MTYIFTAQVGNRNQWSSYMASRRKCDSINLDSLVVRSEIGRNANYERNRLQFNRIVLWELGNLIVEIINRILMSLTPNYAILVRRAVCEILEDFCLLI